MYVLSTYRISHTWYTLSGAVRYGVENRAIHTKNNPIQCCTLTVLLLESSLNLDRLVFFFFKGHCKSQSDREHRGFTSITVVMHLIRRLIQYSHGIVCCTPHTVPLVGYTATRFVTALSPI